MVYTLTNFNSVVRDLDGATIPNDPSNRDWQEYQAWLGAGNTPNPMPPPKPNKQFTFLQFMALFTPTEQDAIITSTDMQVRLFLVMATGAGPIDLDNPEVMQGIQYLASLGLLTSDRAAAILGASNPS